MNSVVNDQSDAVHTPESLTNMLNDSLQSPTDRKLFQIEGVYSDGKGKIYGQWYYDNIIDAVTERKLTLRMPKNVKPLLLDGVCYKFSGFLNHSIPNRQDLNISLNFHVLKVLGDHGKLSGKESGRAELLEKKSESGFKNVEKFIFTQFSKGRKALIHLVVGNEAITDSDFIIGMGDSLSVYEVNEHRINLNSVDEIVAKISELDNEDECIIAVVRGGGELSIFDDVQIARSVLSLKNVFVTAIGHATDVSVLDRIADQSFDTPSFLGSFFKESASLYTRREEESDRRDSIIKGLRQDNERLHRSNEDLINKMSQKDVALNGIWSDVLSTEEAVNRISSRMIQIASRHSVGNLIVSFLLGVIVTVFFSDIMQMIDGLMH